MGWNAPEAIFNANTSVRPLDCELITELDFEIGTCSDLRPKFQVTSLVRH